MVASASNGPEALAALQTQRFDLMFMDLNMPGMSGMELLMEVHRQQPTLPVLILTAHATLDSAIQAVRLGARDYLLKPAEPSLILTRVIELLAEFEQPQRKREIVGLVQDLLAELQQIDNQSQTPTQLLAAVPPADSARFLQKGPFILDLHSRHTTIAEKYIPVPGINFDYLVTLVRHAPKTISNKALVKESQGFEVTAAEARDLARWRIHELRKMIEADHKNPKYLLTVRSEGYRLDI